jgi:hypothetical protein
VSGASQDAILSKVPSESPNRALVYVLGGALFASLLVIAFLLGRESSRTAAPSDAGQTASSTADGSGSPATTPVPERRWPEWADLDDADPDVPDPEVTETHAGRIERHQDGRIVLSNRNLDGSSHTPTSDSPTTLTRTEPSSAVGTTAVASDAGAVVAYFERVDAIRSSNDAVDPNAFAMDLIKASMKGSTEGFDELIADGVRMQNEMAAIEPPPACAVYHRESLAAMAQSQAILETMRDAIQSGNIQALTQVTSQASVLQSKAETLDALRQQILANARR